MVAPFLFLRYYFDMSLQYQGVGPIDIIWIGIRGHYFYRKYEWTLGGILCSPSVFCLWKDRNSSTHEIRMGLRLNLYFKVQLFQAKKEILQHFQIRKQLHTDKHPVYWVCVEYFGTLNGNIGYERTYIPFFCINAILYCITILETKPMPVPIIDLAFVLEKAF